MGKKYIFWDIDKTLLCLSGVIDTLSSDQQKNLSSDATSVKVGWNDRLKTEIHSSFQALYIEEHKRFFISILELCKKGKADVRILTASIYPEIEILFELNSKFLTKPVLDLSQTPYINRSSLGGAFNIMSTVDDSLVGDNKFFSSPNEIFGMGRGGCTIEKAPTIYYLLTNQLGMPPESIIPTDIILIDDEPTHRDCMSKMGYRSIDSTLPSYPAELVKLLEEIRAVDI